MNSREQEVKKKYKEQGWRMLRGGAPDFVAIRVDTEGNIGEFMGVEVKSENGNLSYEQSVYRKLFALAGIPYVVEVVPAQANPNHSRPGQSKLIQPTPDHSTPVHLAPIHPYSSQISPDRAIPHETSPSRPTPAQTTLGQPAPFHTAPGQTIPNHSKPFHTNSNQRRTK